MATKSKTIKIEFYRVGEPAGAPSFDSILGQISELPNTQSRTRDLGDRHVRMRSIAEANGLWEGDLTRIRMTAVPGKAGLDGSFEPFDFDDDEGLGEETAFLYHARSKVLVIQYNHFGTTPSLFSRYMEVMGNIDDMIDFEPAIHPDALTRLRNMREYRRLEIGLAGLDDSSSLSQQGESLNGMVDVINAFQAPRAEIAISMGHESGSLAARAVMNTLRYLRGRSRTQVTKVRVHGKEGHDTRVVDLINDRLTESAKIELDQHRRLPYNDRRSAVKSAWDSHRRELASMFTGG